MGALQRTLRDLPGSEQTYREALERTTRTLGPDHAYTRLSVQGLAETLVARQQHADAEAVLAPAEASFRRAATADGGSELRRMLVFLGKARAAQGKFKPAEAALKEAYDAYVAFGGPGNRGAQVSAESLAALYDAWHTADPSQGFDRTAAEWRSRLTPATTRPATAPATTPAPGNR
jgi:hypothetical protein